MNKSGKYILLISLFSFIMLEAPLHSQERLRDYGISIGIFQPGRYNSITDVTGVKVGHKTIVKGDSIRTGVTAIIPHEGNIFRNKVPAAIYAGNGFGKLAGYTQVKELGNIETPVILTNTLSIAAGLDALITYSLSQKGNEQIGSVNGIVGETNDGSLNDIRARAVTSQDVLDAISVANSGPVQEGSVGAGKGTVCFGFKGGIGTSSRVLPESLGGYTVGVLVQSNYGGVLEIAGVPVGKMLGVHSYSKDVTGSQDGSCMMVVITDAPVTSRNLERIAKRAMMGLAKTGGIASNGSGDYVIAMSVARENLIDESTDCYNPTELHNHSLSPLFLATIEATEEALINSLFAATTTVGYRGRKVERLPVDFVVKKIKEARGE
jgi:D-aminopeptidase